jgi:hypothetical protein
MRTEEAEAREQSRLPMVGVESTELGDRHEQGAVEVAGGRGVGVTLHKTRSVAARSVESLVCGKDDLCRAAYIVMES